jgi:hypothetical protein
MCKNCGHKICVLDDPTDGRAPARLEGQGRFSVRCYHCQTDELIYETSEISSFQAEADGPPSSRLPRRKPSNKPKQLVKTRYPTAKPTFGPTSIEERPECAVIIARCVSLWSYIEADLALLLSAVLRIGTGPAVAMFLAIQSGRTQLDVLTAAAKIELTASDYELFDAIMNVRHAVEKERNNLAHGLIGESMIVKEGILWISQRDLTEHTARVWYEGLDPVDSSITKAHTFVYEPEDLETIAQNMEWLHQVIGVFRGYISSENAQWRAARYHQLCADPRIAKELSRMRRSEKVSKGRNDNPAEI